MKLQLSRAGESSLSLPSSRSATSKEAVANLNTIESAVGEQQDDITINVEEAPAA